MNLAWWLERSTWEHPDNAAAVVLRASGSGEPAAPAASRCCARKLATRSFPWRPPA